MASLGTADCICPRRGRTTRCVRASRHPGERPRLPQQDRAGVGDGRHGAAAWAALRVCRSGRRRRQGVGLSVRARRLGLPIRRRCPLQSIGLSSGPRPAGARAVGPRAPPAAPLGAVGRGAGRPLGRRPTGRRLAAPVPRGGEKGALVAEYLRTRVWVWDNSQAQARCWHLFVRREVSASATSPTIACPTPPSTRPGRNWHASRPNGFSSSTAFARPRTNVAWPTIRCAVGMPGIIIWPW